MINSSINSLLSNYRGTTTLVGGTELTDIDTTIADTAVDVFVYDTRKDSDGGAWRERTQHTSWYNETLNTSTRGSRKDFPAVAVIVAEADTVTIYDGDDPTLPMWMVFNQSLTSGTQYSFLVGGSLSCITARNATIFVGRASLLACNFIKDEMNYGTNGIRHDYKGAGLSSRNTEQSGLPSSGVSGNPSIITGYIVNSTVNDVAMTVLPSAPIDSATGIAVPTIAVATAGGLSVIRDDGTVVDITGFSSSVPSINFTSDNKIVCRGDFAAHVDIHNIPTSDTTASTAAYTYSTATIPATLGGTSLALQKTAAINELEATYAPEGLCLIDRETTLSNSMVNYITSSYNTGWMFSDVKGAFLSDTTAETVGVDETTELVTNGTFDSDLSGWTAGPTAISTWNASGYVDIDRNNEGDGKNVFYQAITTVAGKVYSFSADIIDDGGANNVKLMVTDATSGGSILKQTDFINSTGTICTIEFVAASSTTYIHITPSGTFTNTCAVDNISVKQTGNLVVNGTFDVNTSGWTASSLTGVEDGTLSVESGQLKITNTVAAYGSAYQAVSTEVGKTYVFSYSYDATNSADGEYIVRVGTTANGNEIINYPVTTGATTGSETFTFTATTTTTYITLAKYNAANTAFYMLYDNISVRLAEEDRSVNGNGLEVHGQITKAAVATGADLVAYSGFTLSGSYLYQPYNSDLAFGSSDHYVMGWLKGSDTDGVIIQRSQNPSTHRISVNVTGSVAVFNLDDGTSSLSATGTSSLTGSNWIFICGVRDGNTARIYVNGNQEGTADITSLGSIDSGSDDEAVFFGISSAISNNYTGSLALWRIGAGAPTAAQIAKIYEDEKYLFQDGAQATLYGSSDAVTALAYDEVTDLLSVGTSAGRSDFSGLRRVTNTTTAVTTAISAYDSLIIEQ